MNLRPVSLPIAHAPNGTHLAERLARRIDYRGPDECWEWLGGHNRAGYSILGGLLVHRAVYELLVGPIPRGLGLDHLCRNRACCNPAHLEPVTHRVNVMRGVSFSARNALLTHCAHGHAFDEANTYYRPRGGRGCRACTRLSQRRYKARRSYAA